MLNKNVKDKIIKDFSLSDSDTGSSQVQIALLSARIRQISDHLKSFPKDKHSRLGLVKLVGKRRSFYNYLKKKNIQGYKDLIQKLKNEKYI
jgi:small subunit ribosomal protein S15